MIGFKQIEIFDHTGNIGRDFIGLRRQTAPPLDLGTLLSPLMQLVPDICWTMVSGDGGYQDYLAGSFLAQRLPNSLNAARFKELSHPKKDSGEGKPARRPTHDYGRFFIETVPKRYMFGTGARRNFLIFCGFRANPELGALNKTHAQEPPKGR